MERRTSEETFWDIHFVKEGMWRRLYEWSVFLYNELVKTGIVDKLKTVNKANIVYCGISESSLDKCIKELSCKKIDDAHFVGNVKVLLSLQNITLENYDETLEEFQNIRLPFHLPAIHYVVPLYWKQA